LERQQYENPSYTQENREKGCGDAGTNEPADPSMMLQPGHGRIGADIAQGHGRAIRQIPVELGAYFNLAEEGTLRLARAGGRFIRQGEEVGDMQIIVIPLTTREDDGGGDHPFRTQPVLFHEGPKGAPQGQQGPRAEQAPEDQIDLGDQDIARLGAGEQLAHLGGILQAGPPDRVVASEAGSSPDQPPPVAAPPVVPPPS
jgi:hypothetical protein